MDVIARKFVYGEYDAVLQACQQHSQATPRIENASGSNSTPNTDEIIVSRCLEIQALVELKRIPEASLLSEQYSNRSQPMYLINYDLLLTCMSCLVLTDEYEKIEKIYHAWKWEWCRDLDLEPQERYRLFEFYILEVMAPKVLHKIEKAGQASDASNSAFAFLKFPHSSPIESGLSSQLPGMLLGEFEKQRLEGYLDLDDDMLDKLKLDIEAFCEDCQKEKERRKEKNHGYHPRVDGGIHSTSTSRELLQHAKSSTNSTAQAQTNRGWWKQLANKIVEVSSRWLNSSTVQFSIIVLVLIVVTARRSPRLRRILTSLWRFLR